MYSAPRHQRFKFIYYLLFYYYKFGFRIGIKAQIRQMVHSLYEVAKKLRMTDDSDDLNHPSDDSDLADLTQFPQLSPFRENR